MIALVLGGTGATGKQLVELLLSDERFTEVHVYVRRQLPITQPKLRVHLVDFERPEDWEVCPEADVAFSCLGTTIRDAGSQEAQRRVEVDYQLQFAQMAKRNGVKAFVLLSSMSANPTSKFFYMRVKGEIEELIKALDFERTLIYRPGMIDRGAEARLGERLSMAAVAVLNALYILCSQRPIPTVELASQLIKGLDVVGPGVHTFDFEQIRGL